MQKYVRYKPPIFNTKRMNLQSHYTPNFPISFSSRSLSDQRQRRPTNNYNFTLRMGFSRQNCNLVRHFVVNLSRKKIMQTKKQIILSSKHDFFVSNDFF